MTVEVFDYTGERRDLAWLEQTYRAFPGCGAGAKFQLARIDITNGPAVFTSKSWTRMAHPKPTNRSPITGQGSRATKRWSICKGVQKYLAAPRHRPAYERGG
ncbi:MAG: hypothetical protein HZY76_02715 [Anaerolineae bacterium]|nr:MAG: hypothetical protein HZY76_02715 [Anaerolineae bacterium]